MTMSILLYLPVRAPSPQSSPPRGRGSLGGRAIRRGNDDEHSGLSSVRAPSPQSSPPRGRGSLGGRAIRRGTTMSIRLGLPVRAPSPQSSPPRGRGSSGGRAIRRGNNDEHSGLFPCVPPHLNPLPRGGEEVWPDAQFGEAMTMSILVYFPCAPPHLDPLPRGGEEVWRTRNPERQQR